MSVRVISKDPNSEKSSKVCQCRFLVRLTNASEKAAMIMCVQSEPAFTKCPMLNDYSHSEDCYAKKHSVGFSPQLGQSHNFYDQHT
jgi:hypothetical protein